MSQKLICFLFLVATFLKLVQLEEIDQYYTNAFSTYDSSYPSTTETTYVSDINSNARKSEIFDKLFKENDYDAKLRPPGLHGSGPTVINVSLHIRSIENINDVRMEYSVQMTFRQEWVDPRLKYSHIQNNIKYLQLVNEKKNVICLIIASLAILVQRLCIWEPDVFFTNEKDSRLHSLMIPNLFTRIYPNGKIWQSYRITLLLSCPMDLHAYPLDVQQCPVQMASYGWTTDDLILRWRKNNPVEMVKEFKMARFKMQNQNKEPKISYCESGTITGNYSCMKFEVAFEREFGYYLIQIYIPCSMLSLVSWVTFWLEPSAVEARVSLGVTTILAIVTTTYGINQSAPPTSYIKAMDVWTAFCQIMVFGALLEFAVVNYITHFGIVVRKKRLLAFHEVENLIRPGEDPSVQHKLKQQAIEVAETKMIARALIKAKKVDLTAKFLFPIVFCIFNVVYWGHFMNLYFGLIEEFKTGLSDLKV